MCRLAFNIRGVFAGVVIMTAMQAQLMAGGPERDWEVVFNREPLAPSAFAQLPPGAIRARGWLAEQLRLQIEGLTGHLEQLFSDVGPDSAWLGGQGEDWERGPYYLRGATALAYATRDEAMLRKIQPWIEWTLNSQKEDGYFGPDAPTPQTPKGEGYNDWWPRMIMLQVLQMHHEATGDPRVIPFMTKYCRYSLDELKKRPLRSWAYMRGGDFSSSVYWLYNRTGDAWLLELGELLIEQTHDWSDRFTKAEPLIYHVVNLSQGYKQPGVIYQQTKDPKHREALYRGIARAMEEHGRIDGLHSGDEAQAGRSSVRGTELCAVVEYMHSFETLLKIFGDPALADALEKVAYNALPAMHKPDWKGHQYFSQPNQVLCTREPHGFVTDHGDDLTLGVLTGYPCCATNMHQGWPKLTHHLWLATKDGGLAVGAYAPCVVDAQVAGGVKVRIEEKTDYPFRGQVTLVVTPEKEVEFPLKLRIPGWCTDATIKVNGQAGPAAKAGQFMDVQRTWKAGDTVELDFPMELRTSTWENNSVGIERGPLVYAMTVAEDWRRFPDWRRGDVVDDWPQWEVHPAAAWNYGLAIDRANPSAALKVDVRHVPPQPWSPQNAPVRITAPGHKIPEWGMGEHNNAAPVPESPVKVATPEEQVTLLPFGATRLRIAYLPIVESD